MVFSDTTYKDGLIQDCEQTLFGNYGVISGNSDLLFDITARINRAYDKAANLIMSSDGRWKWDDTNYTTLPIGKRDIVSGQQDYTMDVEHLEILKVVVVDSAGIKTELAPYALSDELGTLEAQNIVTTGGIPNYYRKTGVSFMLFPIPNYNATNGLIVYYQRKPSYFIYSDTTKSAGIPSILHRYLSITASADYAVSKQLTMKNDLVTLSKELENDVVDFYSKRAKDESKFIRAINRSSR